MDLEFPKKRWLVLLVGSVTVLSFLTGLFIGFGRDRLEEAQARGVSFSALPRDLIPVPGMYLTAIGNGSELNGSRSELFSFSSMDSVKQLLKVQVALWQERGFVASGMATERRGVAFAVNKGTKEMYQVVVFYCPEVVRERICSGQRIFGVTSYLSHEQLNPEEKLPINLCLNGVRGGTYSAADLGKSSVTTSVVCPLSLEQAEQFFDAELEGQGWRKLEGSVDAFTRPHTCTKFFVRGDSEISYLLSSSQEAPEKTLAVVIYRSQ